MPRQSIWFVRTALLHLGAGFTVGALILWNKGTGALPAAWRLLPMHIETVLLGWTLQLAMGVAFWILPRLRFDGRPTRGNETILWLVYALLNGGILAVVAAGLPGAPAALVAVGRAAEVAAVVLFARHAWPRVKRAGTS